MMTAELTPEQLEAAYDRNTYRPPTPLPEAKAPTKPQRHPLAGRTPGVRATSRKALLSVKPTLGRRQSQILTVLLMHDDPMCDLQILDYLVKSTADTWKINAVVARRNELVEMGKVEEAYRDVYAPTGKRVIFWKAAQG